MFKMPLSRVVPTMIVVALSAFGAQRVAASTLAGSCRVSSPSGASCTYQGRTRNTDSWNLTGFQRGNALRMTVSPAGAQSYDVDLASTTGSVGDCSAGCPGSSSSCCTAATPSGGASVCASDSNVAVCVAYNSDGEPVGGGSCNCSGVS